MKKIAMNKKIKRDRSERSNGSDKKIKGSDRLTKNGELNEEKSSQQLVSLMSYQCQRNDKSGVGLNFNCPNPLTWWIPSFIFSEIAIFLALISLPLQSSAKSAKTIGWKSPSIARLDEGTPLAVRKLRAPPPPPASHQLNETEPPEGTVKSEICHNTWDDCSDGPCCVCGEYHDFAEHCPYFCEIPPGKIPLRGFQVVCYYCRTPMCYLIGRYVKEFQGKEPHGKPCVRGKKCSFCKDSGHMHGLCPGRVQEILPALEGDQYELPKLRPVASTDVVVTNLTPKVTEYDLFRHFGRLGANGMRSVDVDKIEGKHYGHLEFRNLEYASLAIQKANVSTTTLDGQRIKCHIVKLPHLSVNWDAFKKYSLN